MNAKQAQKDKKDTYITLISVGAGIPTAINGTTTGTGKTLLNYLILAYQKFIQKRKSSQSNNELCDIGGQR
jgi:hypothetical protein